MIKTKQKIFNLPSGAMLVMQFDANCLASDIESVNSLTMTSAPPASPNSLQ